MGEKGSMEEMSMFLGSKDNDEEDECCVAVTDDPTTTTTPPQRVKVFRHGKEREVRLLLVVEEFRLAFYLTFISIVIIGLILTKAFVTVDYEAQLREAFGVLTVCMFFDYPPSTYVLPSIYSIALMFIYAYGIASVFRAWVAKEEGKISRSSFAVYVAGFVYVVMSFIVFTTIFAVQPHVDDPHSIKVHTAPYTNLTVALFVLALLVTWFGEKVAWRDLGIPLHLFHLNRLMVVVQATTVVAKIVIHVNCLADQYNGLWWKPSDSPGLSKMFQVFNYLFLFTVIAWPTVQSGFLSYKRHHTHCVFVSLSDNREAASKPSIIDVLPVKLQDDNVQI